jgi:hypothetical protein
MNKEQRKAGSDSQKRRRKYLRKERGKWPVSALGHPVKKRISKQAFRAGYLRTSKVNKNSRIIDFY